MAKEDLARYAAAAHAMQSGVAFNPDKRDQEPKHLRVGINARAADQAGLVRLLIEKGVFTQDEYEKAIADSMERERDECQASLSAALGRPVNLA